jgi:4a-hydroxytetrahydrobiopterin dehydratase
MKKVKLTPDEIRERLERFPQWRYVDERLERVCETGTFVNGVDLVVKIGAMAEEMNHHPDIRLSYPRVVVSTRTHDVDGITDTDFDLARRIESWYARA